MDYKNRLKRLLIRAIKEGASDLHLSVGHHPVLRITRVLTELEDEEVISPKDAREFAILLASELQWKKFLTEKEIDFSYDFKEGNARFRASIYFQRDTVSIALRLIPAKIRTLEELNLPPVLHKFTQALQGLVLITGASSQGKSTTLAALIDEINHQRKEHIITIEDPIEYIFKDDRSIIDQREVHRDTLSFSKALRSTLREDPDVIMVGEMRDLETISITLTAAETGHLVFATLHTNSSSQTIHRIVDVFPAFQQNQVRAQLSGSLLGIVAQRLLPGKEGNFIPACEILFSTPAVSNLIRENKIHEIPSIIETSRKDGMISFDQSLVELTEKGMIERETALKYAQHIQDIESRLTK